MLLLTALPLAAATSLPTAATSPPTAVAPSATPAPEPLGPSVRTPPPPPPPSSPPPSRDGGADRVDEEVMGNRRPAAWRGRLHRPRSWTVETASR